MVLRLVVMGLFFVNESIVSRCRFVVWNSFVRLSSRLGRIVGCFCVFVGCGVLDLCSGGYGI